MVSEGSHSNSSKPKKRGTGKFIVLALFIVMAIILFRYTPAKDYLAIEKLDPLIKSFGAWGPLIFMAIYATGVCLFFPATVLTAAGALLFGPLFGFMYNEIGALAGASVAFFIGRYLGRDFAASLIGDRLKKYDDKIEENGFTTVLYLRLVFFPFVPLNFGMGLTKVRFMDYFFGTLLGIIAGGFIITFFFATLGEVWKSGNWSQLLNAKVIMSVALFVFSFFIPKIVNKLKGEV